MIQFKILWRLWAKSLGNKAAESNRESDYVAVIRTIIFITYLITNIFICLGVVRHWNDIEYQKSKPTIVK